MTLQAGSVERAAANLLSHCAGLQPGSRLVVVHETEGQGYYDDRVAPAIAHAATDRGIRTTLCPVPFREAVGDLDAEMAELMAGADCTIFFARLGDQVRFRALPKGSRAVVSYVLDMEMLTSPFGTAHYRAFAALKEAIDAHLATAREIRVTCPHGSDFAGPGPGWRGKPKEDVTIIRFPMSVFAPVPALEFSGQAALAGFLMGTG